MWYKTSKWAIMWISKLSFWTIFRGSGVYACFWWASISFKFEEREKNYLEDQERGPLGVLSTLISAHHFHKYQMKTMESVRLTCFFKFSLCLCTVRQSSLGKHVPLKPFQRHICHMYFPYVFCPKNVLQGTYIYIAFNLGKACLCVKCDQVI